MEETTFIKTTDKKLALALEQRGFSYITENLQLGTVYSFPATPELILATNELYEAGNVVEDNTLRFGGGHECMRI